MSRLISVIVFAAILGGCVSSPRLSVFAGFYRCHAVSEHSEDRLLWLEADGRYKLLVIPEKEQVGSELHLSWDESGTWRESSGVVRFRSAKGKVKRSAHRVAASGLVIDVDGLRFEREEARPNQALVPTPASVTPAADAPVAPDAGAAHL